MLVLTIDCNYYDYFGGSDKHRYKVFTNLREGWSEYKRAVFKDYDYGDSWQHTRLIVTNDDSIIEKPQRLHARTKEEWCKLKRFMESYECGHLRAAFVEKNAYDIMRAYEEYTRYCMGKDMEDALIIGDFDLWSDEELEEYFDNNPYPEHKYVRS
jgi:hypothetical protein